MEEKARKEEMKKERKEVRKEGGKKEGRTKARKGERKKGRQKTTHPLVYSFTVSSFPSIPFFFTFFTFFLPPLPGFYLSIFVSYPISFFLLVFPLMEVLVKERTNERKKGGNGPTDGISS